MLRLFDPSLCESCPLVGSRTHLVADDEGEAYQPGGVMVMGEAPGYNEDLQGKPFVGDSGYYLERLLDSVGLGRADVYITNTVRCRPPGNKKPTKRQVDFHRPVVEAAIDCARPYVIIALGASALAWFRPKGVLLKACHGKPFLWHGVVVFPTYHPAAAMRNPNIWPLILEDWVRFNVPVDEVVLPDYGLVSEDEVVRAIVASPKHQVGFDLETTDTLREGVFYPHEQRILGYSVAWGEGKAGYVPHPPGRAMKAIWNPVLTRRCATMPSLSTSFLRAWA